MTERPILFNDAMVRAILRGQKTQTRRPVKPQPDTVRFNDARWRSWTCPLGQPGDRLWVRETFARHPRKANTILYRANVPQHRVDNAVWINPDGTDTPVKWVPSIHMPRALSRITLEITDINVEQVQDITNPEAIAEGAHEVHKVGDDPTHPTWTMGSGMWRYDSPREAFAAAWDSIYAKRGLDWRVNPWVWVVDFKQIDGRG